MLQILKRPVVFWVTTHGEIFNFNIRVDKLFPTVREFYIDLHALVKEKVTLVQLKCSSRILDQF